MTIEEQRELQQYAAAAITGILARGNHNGTIDGICADAMSVAQAMVNARKNLTNVRAMMASPGGV